MKGRTIVTLLFLLVVAGVTRAHESRPGYLDLREAEDGSWSVLWKQPDHEVKIDDVRAELNRLTGRPAASTSG